MDSKELRQKFLEFFKERGHRIIPSSSLVPENDLSVLFTAAGMQQFKPYYSEIKNPFVDIHQGLDKPLGIKNVVSCQKCFRTTDINSVGDHSHLTFFEMLGNFSFGDYFKKETINYAWELLTKEFHISQERIKTTVFKGDNQVPFDKESFDILLSLGVPKEAISRGAREDNFWGPTGNEGPCGPTVEFYVDDLELWNLVFNEYYMDEKKNLLPLKTKGVDTGMGLERLALVTQFPKDKTKTIFDTDLFSNLMVFLDSSSKSNLPEEKSLRIIADHLKGIVFLSSEGIEPSNLGRGYILRRLIRRVVRHSRVINLKDDWLKEALNILIKKYYKIYPELGENKENIVLTIEKEIEKFQKTIRLGLKEWEKLVSSLLKKSSKEISGQEAFRLYESYGFPFELIEEMAKEKGLSVLKENFEKEFAAHQEISRAGKEKKFGGHGLKNNQNDNETVKKITRLHTAAHLLLKAIREVLGGEIRQMGSDINKERLRLDFSFNRKLEKEELIKIEDLVNEKIKENLIVSSYETSFEEALKEGILPIAKNQYPEKITIYEIKSSKETTPWSREICAGPHIKETKEIGKFFIIKEESVSQGVRRIKAGII
ncbi:MAG: alanine--tRNA ligase [Candidatus Pacebacteria bacterium]|nr:alanine--tRNA ligase [Candidatus Paceibacterota bacterium]